MYSLSQLRRAFENPHLFARELNRLYHTRFGNHDYNPAGIDVFDQDWDNLIVLDACRYDVFESRTSFPGQLESRTSRAAATSEFVRANFTDRQLHDTVYITGNSWFFKLRDEINAEVHAAYDVVDNPDRQKLDRLTERALEAASEHPHKRLMIHYIPPHHPFVGPTADGHLPPYEDQQSDLFEQIQRGEIDIEDFRLKQAYRENLDRVIPHVQRLLEELGGRTVVTADHGELLGERCIPIPVREYGHHSGLYVDELVGVPWLINDGDRRTIRSDSPVDTDDTGPDSNTVDERLRNLGYKA